MDRSKLSPELNQEIDKELLFNQIDELREEILMSGKKEWRMAATLETTEAGIPRIRGFALDEDAYSGWNENEHFVGAAFVGDMILMETNYPRRDGKPTYLFEVDTSAHTVKSVVSETTRSTFDMPMTADEKLLVLQRVRYNLRDLNDKFEAIDYRKKIEFALDNEYIYQFQTPELQ